MRQSERSLTTELHDHADNGPALLLGVHHFEDVFTGQRFEVKAVGGVIVGRHRLGVAIDHDRLIAGRRQLKRRVHARVVEFDALPDAVGPGAEDDHFVPIGRLGFVFFVVGRVVVRSLGLELRSTGIDGLVHRTKSPRMPQLANLVFREPAQRADLRIAESKPLRVLHQMAIERIGAG